VAADVVGILLAYLIAVVLVGDAGSDQGALTPPAEFLTLVVSLPAWVLLAKHFGMYSRDDAFAGHSTVDDVPFALTVITVGVWLFVAATSLLGLAKPYMPKLIAFWLSAIVLILICRALARRMFSRSAGFLQNCLILGADEIGQRVASKILRHPEYGINIVGFVDSGAATIRDDIGELQVVGGQDDLDRLIESLGVERVIVAFSQEDVAGLIEEIRLLRLKNVQVDLVPRFYDLLGPGAEFHSVEGLPLVSLAPTSLSVMQRFFKRAMDIAASLFGLIVLAPLFVYIAVRIRRDSPGPAMFRQGRPGLNGKSFKMVKFRTMYVRPGEDSDGEAVSLGDPALTEEFERNFKLRSDPRITPTGQWLRRSSLDELPQLWNVLLGQMSLVGPRPLLPAQAEQWPTGAASTLTVKPGMTGYWQINGRSNADYAERIRLEQSYVANYSPWLDISILAKTVGVIISSRGAC
jgi:exopolysaccharide biosynthesis polyprenyl glycosylphosphotransferase